MYFDDGSLRDLASAKRSGQDLVGACFEAFGAPLAEAKRHRLSGEGTCLGVAHNVEAVFERPMVTFWPREACATRPWI